jgi:hypothetical protein
MFEWLENRNAIPVDPYNKPLVFDIEGLEDDDSAMEREAAMANGDFETVRKIVKKIRGIDLRMVDASTALVTNLDLERVPCGTYEESFVSNRSKKPNIIMCPQGIKQIPDWMYGVLPYQFFFDRWSQVKEYLRHIDEDEDIDTLDRWRFFDFEPQILKILQREGWVNTTSWNVSMECKYNGR